MKALLRILVVGLLGIQWSTAHQDDLGDVYPIVRVEGDKFVIYFKNNAEKKNYKTVIGADGKVISERKHSEPIPLTVSPVELSEKEEGIKLKWGDSFYAIPDWTRRHKGKPWVLKIKNEKKEKIELDWGRTGIALVHGAAIYEGGFVLCSSKHRTKKEDRKKDVPFWVYPFALNAFTPDGKSVSSHEIGIPYRIYDFPCDSSVICDGDGRAYIAWMGGIEDRKPVVNLTRFVPETGKLETRRIARGHSNTSPSIGLIGDRILVAWHEKSGEERTGRARIAVKTLSCEKIFRAAEGAGK